MTRPNRQPRCVMLYVAMGALEGALAGWGFLGLLMILDLYGIASLIRGSEAGFLMFQLALVMFGITFGMVGIAWRVMVLLPDEEGEDE